MPDLALNKILEIRQRDFPGLDPQLLEDVYALLKAHAHDEEPERSLSKIRKLIGAHVDAKVAGEAS